MTATETALRDWRYGSTQAERLAAGILRLEKYTNIHPQAPLGGGDDGADILCDRGRYQWVCAVYFPPTQKEFREVKDKFLHDLTGARTHKRNGIVFMTNQRLTKGERKELRDAAAAVNHECEVYDVERIRGALDSAEGYGLRVGYLQIAMNAAEQISFFAARENQLVDLVSDQSQQLQIVLQHIARINEGQAHAYHTIKSIADAQNIPIEPLRVFDPLAVGEITNSLSDSVICHKLDAPMVRLVHRLVCFDLPSRMIGHFRTENVFVKKATAAPGEPTISPPPPAELTKLMDDLCAKWRANIAAAVKPDDKIDAMAKFFYGILFIHPFMDGNGRVARSLLMQQAIELFGHVDMSRFERGVDYYAALQSADDGDYAPLRELIARAITE